MTVETPKLVVLDMILPFFDGSGIQSVDALSVFPRVRLVKPMVPEGILIAARAGRRGMCADRRTRPRGSPPYLTFVPGGRSRSKKGMTALSSMTAARSMAWDSMPRIFAGLRLAMTMRLLPTRSSAA